MDPVGLAGEDRLETFLPDRRRRPAAPHVVVAEGDLVGRGEPVELGFDLAEVFLLAVLGQVPDGDGEVDRRLVELVDDGWEELVPHGAADVGIADESDPGVDAARNGGSRHLRPFRGWGRRQAIAHDCLADVLGVPGAEVHQA